MKIAIAGLGALGLVLAVQSLPFIRRPRLMERVEPYLSGLHGGSSALLEAGQSRPDVLSRTPIGRLLIRLLPKASDDLGHRLRMAGLDTTPSGFRLVQFTWALLSLLGIWAAALLATRIGWGPEAPSFLVLSGLALVSGYEARDWWLGKEIDARRAQLQQELPTAIDLLTLSIIAGEPVIGAFERVSRRLGGAIGAEFGSVVADVRAGAPVVDSLEGLKTRIPIGGISRFVDALCTGIERGSPLAEVLSAQADDGREARRRMLMELGGKREILMLIPVVFLIMPIVVVFALLPGLVSLDLLVP